MIGSEPFERLLASRARPLVARAPADADFLVAALARAFESPILAVTAGPHGPAPAPSRTLWRRDRIAARVFPGDAALDGSGGSRRTPSGARAAPDRGSPTPGGGIVAEAQGENRRRARSHLRRARLRGHGDVRPAPLR